MAITHSLAANPHWVVVDNFSRLPIGAVIYTYHSLNPSLYKPAFQDPGGTIPFTQPIAGLGNGTFPPIYWEFNDADPTDLYYIEVWDKVNNPGSGAVMLWNFSGLTGSGTGGGGGNITTNNDVENLVVNGQFFRNVGTQTGAPSIATLITLAPSNNAGFVGTANGANDGPVLPDIIFAKADQSASDSLNFTDFPQGSNALSPNPTPEQFVNYTCTVAGSEAYKYIQFPIVKGLQNLSNVNVSLKMHNRYHSGDTNITLQWRQFCGNGNNGPSGDVITPIGSLNFGLVPNTWTISQFTSVNIPSIAALTIGNLKNDALFLQIKIPASVQINFDFILPSIYVGTVTSDTDFHTLDEVDAIVNSPRTGDIRTSINSFSPYGWVPMNDGTIGSAASVATTRANVDTFPLYKLIWEAVAQAFAPVTGGRGATAIADFTGNKPMALTRNLGRVMAGALPVAASEAFVRAANTLVVASTAGFYTGMAVTVNVTGGGLTSGVIYYAIVVDATTLSLATTTANALAGTVIVLGAVPNGTIVSVNVETLGSFIGEERHLQATNEVGIHSHTASFSYQAQNNGAGGTPTIGSDAGGTVQNVTVNNSAANVPMNIMQPTVYMNVFIKL